MVILIDNYDSFVYNLGRYIGQLGYVRKIIRNNAITISELESLQPSHIIISPGPCAPDQAGISLEVVKYFSGKVPLLGICLGHQAIGQAFGGKIVRAKRPLHGMSSLIDHAQKGIFLNLHTPITVGRYHSLVIENHSLPASLIPTAFSAEGEVMAVEHIAYSTYGVQFHPESVLTEYGYELLDNFLKIKSAIKNNGVI